MSPVRLQYLSQYSLSVRARYIAMSLIPPPAVSSPHLLTYPLPSILLLFSTSITVIYPMLSFSSLSTELLPLVLDFSTNCNQVSYPSPIILHYLPISCSSCTYSRFHIPVRYYHPPHAHPRVAACVCVRSYPAALYKTGSVRFRKPLMVF
jgi:hypothetical protein